MAFISCRIEVRVMLACVEWELRWVLVDAYVRRVFKLKDKLVCCFKLMADIVGVPSSSQVAMCVNTKTQTSFI